MINDWDQLFSDVAHGMKSSAIRDILKLTQQPDVISFAGGLPAPEVFPLDLFAEAFDTIMAQDGAAAFQYSMTEGYEPLREWLSEWFRSRRNIVADPAEITLTTGSQQSLDLIAKVIINPGDAVVVGAPTYLAAIQAFSAYRPRFISVELDDDGMIVDRLPEIIEREQPKMIYTVPTFQNPSGVCLSADRRQFLAELGERYRILIIEDDPYGELRYEGEFIDPIRSYSKDVLYLTTFSKILAPGLRLGAAAGPAPVIQKMRTAKQAVDLHTGSLDQRLAYHVCKSGFVDEQIAKIVKVYGERQQVMIESIQQHFPADRVHWTHPQGGMFLWVTLPQGADSVEILKQAVEEKVAFVPGQTFYADGSGANTLRLNFSNANPQRIREGIKKLGDLFKRLFNWIEHV